MKRLLGLGSVSLLFFALSGCSGNADGLVQEQIKDMNDLAQAIETNAPDATLKDLQQKMQDTGKKLDDLKLSDDDKKKLIEAHKDEITKASTRLVKAMMGKAGRQLPGMPTLNP